MTEHRILTNELKRYLDNYRFNKQKCGIVLGDVGIAISLSELYKLTQDNYYLNKMIFILNETITNVKCDFSLGYGIAGLSWGISLIDNNLIRDRNEWLLSINEALIKEYKFMLKNNNLDYFKGATGLLFYFLNSPVKNSCSNIEILISLYIETVALKLSSKHLFELPGYSDKILNLGTPHGITGILLMLLNIKEKGFNVNNDICYSLFDIIFSYEFKDNKVFKCHFPSKVFQNGKCDPSGLSWCYGDLMIAYAMLKYGRLFKDENLLSKGDNILQNTIKMKVIHSENLILCHGYPSLSIIYDMIYKETGNRVFFETAQKYKTKLMRSFYYSFYEYKKEKSHKYFFEESSMFIGYSGFILTLLYWSGCDNSWFKCLLL